MLSVASGDDVILSKPTLKLGEYLSKSRKILRSNLSAFHLPNYFKKHFKAYTLRHQQGIPKVCYLRNMRQKPATCSDDVLSAIIF